MPDQVKPLCVMWFIIATTVSTLFQQGIKTSTARPKAQKRCGPVSALCNRHYRNWTVSRAHPRWVSGLRGRRGIQVVAEVLGGLHHEYRLEKLAA
jgi:hypothetical protein